MFHNVYVWRNLLLVVWLERLYIENSATCNWLVGRYLRYPQQWRYSGLLRCETLLIDRAESSSTKLFASYLFIYYSWRLLSVHCRHIRLLTNERPTWCHLLFYFTYYALNMFRTLIYPSSGWSSASACKTNTTKYQPQQKLQHTTNWEQDDRCCNSSTLSQAPEDGYINLSYGVLTQSQLTKFLRDGPLNQCACLTVCVYIRILNQKLWSNEIICTVLRINQKYFSSKKEYVEMFSAYMQQVNLKVL